METSTTSSDFTSGKSISTETTSGSKNENSTTILYILAVITLFAFLYYILSKSAEMEQMSPAVTTQLMANDSQDIYLSGGPMGSTDIYASGNFLNYWNQPTRVSSGYSYGAGTPNRGQLISTIPQIKPSKAGLVPLNTPGNLNSIENTVFPRVIPQSTVSTYPDINNILVNQKEDNDLMERELSKQDLTHGLPPRTNTLRAGATNTLQNALVNSCQYCASPGNCQGCPMCLDGLTSHPKADELASNKVDAKSIGDMSEESNYMTLENFDSCLTGQTMPSKVHNQIKKKIVRKQENFDSGISNQIIPSKIHKNVSNKILNKYPIFANSNVDDNDMENFSTLSNKGIPIKVYNEINKKIIRKNEIADSGMSSQNITTTTHDNIKKKIINKHPIFANSNEDDMENFSNLTNNTMPTRVHNKINKKMVRRQENFDSGLSNQGMPSKVHDNMSNKILNKHPIFATIGDDEVENFSRLTNNTMPVKVQKKILKKLNKKAENFQKNSDDNIIFFVDEVNDGNENLVGNPLRMDTGSCANCPQARCVNCPVSKCSNSLNCPLGYPCKSCEVQDYLNSRTTIDDTENFSNVTNQRENFDCPCRRKVISATNLNQKKFPLENFDSNGIVKKKGVKDLLNDASIIDNRDLFTINDNKSKLENFQCSLEPNSTECKECVSMCPCRFGNCGECPACQQGKCKSCPKHRCPCLMGRCKDCPACKQGNCPMCPKNNQNITENFASLGSSSTVGFGSLCPCGNGRCTNCPLCRNGNCPDCPKVKPSSTFVDLASFGDSHGGYRLGTNWNDATTGPNPVDIGNGITFFPDSYVGSYFTNPRPDIVYPYAVIPPSRTVAGLNVDFGNK